VDGGRQPKGAVLWMEEMCGYQFGAWNLVEELNFHSVGFIKNLL
jgi:hypothetical protein